MIDIHTHVLPNIIDDDGPKDLEISKAMLDKAYSEGVTKIVATPHMLKPHPNRRAEILKAIQSLDHKQVSLYVGSEIFGDELVLKDKENLIPLGDSNYLLIEFFRAQLPHNLEEIFFSLQTNGFECIFAHPERNGSIIENPNYLLQLINAGVLCQINAGSLLGSYGKESQKTARILLEHNMAHFIASDMHSLKHRYYSLKEAVAIATKYTENALALVTTNPKTILEKGYLEVSEPKEYKKKGFWFLKF